MSDQRLRDLERRWIESGTPESRKAYARERKRVGLEKLPREVVRHYVQESQHGVCNGIGNISLPKDMGNMVFSPCAVELWPRLGAEGHGYARSMRKNIYYTEDQDEVTCKRCIKSINKPTDGKRRRRHYAPGSKTRDTAPVCGRDDSDKFEESVLYSMRGVNCPSCRRIMKQGRRRPRSPRRLALV